MEKSIGFDDVFDIYVVSQQYICSHCGYTTNDKLQYDNHIANQCTKILRCKWCKSTFETKKQLHDHRFVCITHCKYCNADVSGKRISSLNEYDIFQIRHNVATHEKKCTQNFTCRKCQKQMSSHEDLKAHLKEHNTMKIVCVRCNHRFTHPTAKSIHEPNCQNNCGMNKLYVCSHCQKIFGSDCEKTLHESTCVSNNTCGFCDKFDPTMKHFGKEHICEVCVSGCTCPFCNGKFVDITEHLISCYQVKIPCKRCFKIAVGQMTGGVCDACCKQDGCSIM